MQACCSLTRANDLHDVISSYIMQYVQLSDLEAKEGSESISLAATLRNPFVPQTERLNKVSIKRLRGAAAFRVVPAYTLLVA